MTRLRFCLIALPLWLLLTPGLFAAGSPDVELRVRWFGQTTEERWGKQPLGTSKTLTLHSDGCAVTAAAMVLDYYNVRTNPSRLNKWLVRNDGFDDGWDDKSGEHLGKVRILWNVPAEGWEQIGGYKRIDFRDKPADAALIRAYLDRKVPVIAEVKRPGGIPHFVVIYGYRRERFLIRDPLNKKTRYLDDVYNVSDRFGSGPARNIYGLRIYEPSGS